jgi:hypothetical protein
MLTTEDRQRIEEEERKRQAEEQYRAEVRAKLQQPPSEEAPAPVKHSNRLVWILGIGLVVAIMALFISFPSKNRPKAGDDGAPVAKSAASAAPVLKTRYVPVNQKLATGQIIVKAKVAVQYRITITPEMVEPTVTGTFNASGGSGNDIMAVITDETNYTNWINGHQAKVFWGTQGQQTTGNFELKLGPGTYYLAFSNKFSAVTDKQVFLEVDLNYKRAETYY